MHRDGMKKGVRETAVTLQKYTGIMLDVVVCIYMLLILVVMPFYYQEGYAHIGTDKSVFFFKASLRMGRIAVPLLALHLILLAAAAWRKKGNASRLWAFMKAKASVTDLFAVAYGVVLLVSYAFSRYKGDALWGAPGWYMGLYRQLMLIGIYFYISKWWKPRKWIFYMMLPASAVVFLLEYLNRFDIFPLKMGNYGAGFISTIGNINWYCGYQVSVFFAGMVLLWQGISYKMWQRLLLAAYVMLGFASLVTQGSRSGMAALAAVLLVMFCMSVSDSDRMCRFWQEMLLFSGACLLTCWILRFLGRKMNYREAYIDILTSKEAAVFMTVVSVALLALATVNRKRKSHLEDLWRTLERLCIMLTVLLTVGYTAALIVNTLRPGSIGVLSELPAFTFSDKWGSGRGATWKAGALCFWEQDFLHKLVGVGPDAMEAYIYNGGSPGLLKLVKSAFAAARLTNAHNEWLTVLVNTGILGFASYVGFMVSAMTRLVNRKSSNLVSCACGFCILGYTVNNMFSFQQSMNAAVIFVVLGMGEAFYKYNSEKLSVLR